VADGSFLDVPTLGALHQAQNHTVLCLCHHPYSFVSSCVKGALLAGVRTWIRTLLHHTPFGPHTLLAYVQPVLICPLACHRQATRLVKPQQLQAIDATGSLRASMERLGGQKQTLGGGTSGPLAPLRSSSAMANWADGHYLKERKTQYGVDKVRARAWGWDHNWVE
jgi:hypothetical protein